MKRLLLCIIPLVTGCAPVIQAELDLVAASRKGVAMTRESVEARQELVSSLLKRDRDALATAFDEDVLAQDALDPAWVIEARRAYATAFEAMVRRDESVRASFLADLDNLAAIDEALVELERLNQQQLQWISRVSQ